MEGWIKLHRKLISWEWYNDSNMVHLFIHLILSANHKPGNWKGIDLERGQLITGRNKLSEQTGISHQSIRTCLQRLKSTNELTIKSTNKYSILTVCNYDDYQIKNGGTNQQLTSKLTNNQPATNQQPTTNKKVKNVKKFIKPTLDEVKKYCGERNKGVNPVKWFNHYKSNGWKVGKNLMKNWKAAVHTWENSDIQPFGQLLASKGTNLKGDPLPENYGERSKTAVQRGDYLKSKKEKK